MTDRSQSDGCTTDELRELFLFENLDDEQLDWVRGNGDVVELPAGADVPARASRPCASSSCWRAR